MLDQKWPEEALSGSHVTFSPYFFSVNFFPVFFPRNFFHIFFSRTFFPYFFPRTFFLVFFFVLFFRTFFSRSFFPRIFFPRTFFLIVVQNVGLGVLYDVRVLSDQWEVAISSRLANQIVRNEPIRRGVTCNTSASEQYIRWENRHWHSVFYISYHYSTSRYVMLHLMSIALVKYLLLQFESTVQ